MHVRPTWLIVLAALAAACDGLPAGTCNSNQDCASGESCISGKCEANTSRRGCAMDEMCGSDQYCDIVDRTCKARSAPPPRDGGNGDASLGADAVGSGDDTGFASDAVVALGDGAAGADASVPPADTGVAPADTGVAPADTGVAPADMGVGPADTGVVARDTGPADTGVAPRDSGVPCAIDGDCGNPALRCDAPMCVLRCDRGGTACTGTLVCSPESGRCVAGNLAIGATCGFDAQCTTGMCLPITRMGMTQRVCASPCGASSNCPLNFSCVNLNGMSFCLGETLFSPPATFDVAAGGACTAASNTCQSSWCNTGMNQCIETCSRNSDCTGFGGNCWTYAQTLMGQQVYDHLCLAQTNTANGGACATNSTCRSGICNRYVGRCAAHCCRDADCAAAESCTVYDLDTTTGEIVKICAPRSTMAGTSPLGAACATAATCESEVCAPLVPTSTTSPRKCSTLCCTNADCTSLPTGGRCRPFSGPTINMISTIVGVCVPN